MDNRLRHLSGLRYFEVAARLHSYSKAAEELFVSQAAVSQKIRQLEEQVGCKLFIRKGRVMALTHEGRTLFKHVSDGFQEVLLGLNKIQSEPIQGLLVVRSPPSFASRWLLLICSSQTGHLAKRHFAFQSSLGLGTQEHCAFSFDYNQLLCTRRSFGASALSS